MNSLRGGEISFAGCEGERSNFSKNRIAVCVASTWLTYRAFSPCAFLLTKLHAGFDHFIIDPAGGESLHDLIVHIKFNYDCIVSCEYAWMLIGDFSGLKIAIVDDLHRWGRHRVDHDRGISAWSDIILSTYHFTDKHSNFPGSIPTEQRRQFVYFPHFAIDVPDTPLPFEDREFAIVPGAAVENFYPMRCLARQIDGVAIPGSHGLKELSRQDFIKQIGHYKVGITCNLTLRYVIAKYFEIPMAGTALLAADVPHPLEKYLLGFNDTNSKLIPSSKEADIGYIAMCANELASDEAKWTEIASNGRALVRSRHTPFSRYQYIYSIACSALRGRWHISDQYEHFIASWQENHTTDLEKTSTQAVHSIATLPFDLQEANSLILEPDEAWWYKMFPHGSVVSGDYTSSNPRAWLSLPPLNGVNHIGGRLPALLKADGPYDCIVAHDSYGFDAESIEYLLKLLKPNSYLYIFTDGVGGSNASQAPVWASRAFEFSAFEDYIRVRGRAAEADGEPSHSALIERQLSSPGQANRLLVYKLLRNFWIDVARRSEEIVGIKLAVSLDDRFWIAYGALRLWAGADERSAPCVSLEYTCHSHIFIGIQSFDFGGSHHGMRDRIFEICSDLKLVRSSERFIGFEHFNDLGLPMISADQLVADEKVRFEFLKEQENIKESISEFIAVVLSRLLALETTNCPTYHG